MYTTGDYVSIRQDVQKGKIEGIFIHELSPGEFRLFVRLIVVEESDPPRMDYVLQTPLLQFTDELEVVGLPAIDAKKLYILQVTPKIIDDARYGLERGGKQLLLHCNYDIQFM